jgi:predicted DNA-binding transcriptional regulator AlpA
MQKSNNQGFYRLPSVLERIPVSRSAWWAGIQAGRFPPGKKLSPRTTAWERKSIDELCNLLAKGKDWRDHEQKA